MSPRKYGPGKPLPDGDRATCEHCQRVIVECSSTCSCHAIAAVPDKSWQHLDQWHACDPANDESETAEPLDPSTADRLG